MEKHEELSNPNSCWNKAKDDEPLFIVKASDPAAQAAIRAWTEERIALGINTRSDDKMVSAADIALEMFHYRSRT